jgi:plastocyanin
MSGPRTPAPPRLLTGGIAAVCAVLLAVLVSCGTSGTSSSSGTAAAVTSASGTSGAAVITIQDFTFTTPESVAPGATVTVRNQDSTAHTVTADSGKAFDDAAPPGTSTFTAPAQPGSYPFHCSIHLEMHGVLVVK